MLQAMNTGHDGSLSTVHANAPRDALARVETMVLMAGYDLPVRAIRQQVSSALDMICHIERLEDGSRRVHGRHRGAAHGVRRDHAPGHLRVQDRVVRARRHDQRAPPGDRAPPGVPATSSRSAGSTSPRGSSRTAQRPRTSRTCVDESASLDRPGGRRRARGVRHHAGLRGRRLGHRRGRGRRGRLGALPRPGVRPDVPGAAGSARPRRT